MATSEDAAIPPSTSAGFPDDLSHFMLVVVGEPLAEDYIDLILAEVGKGLKNWSIDADAVDYNDVLKSVAEADPVKSGLVHVSFGFAGAHLGVVVLINPTSEQLSQELRSLLAHSAANKHVSFGGHSAEGTGDWVLHDDTYTLHDIAEVFSEPDVDAALLKGSQDEKQTLCLSGCHWSAAAVTKQPFSKSLNLAINPQEAKHDVEGVSLVLETIRSMIEVLSPFDLMEPPTMGVGIKCKITKPTVLIFPAAKGDCAFFAVSDFSLFVGGGYSIKSCFWKFAKHLHRVDAVILPHTRPDTVIGINSLLRRKIAERQLEAPEIGAEGYEDWQIKCNSPEVGVVYMNAPDNKQSPKSLVLKTVGQGNETTQLLQQLSIKPFACTANGGKEIKPITLYLKVGIGKLDMYILSPTQDSKELKDFLQQWSTGKAFGKVKTGVKVNGKETEVPLPNACSICALMVWQPASPHENIVRVLFPGNAPQSKIIEGLDRVKHLEFLKYPDAVQSSSGKITAMKKKDVAAMNMKKAAAGGSGAVNGSVNGKTSQMKENNVCTDGVHCNTPPPSPSGICTDGVHCNTPPPGTVCTDGVHCNTPPPGTVCTDGVHCNTPPPSTVCTDGVHCNTPPLDTVCTDGVHCNTPPPDIVCTDGEHCNTPPPGTVCTDGKNCNTPPPGTACTDGEHCNTPPPDTACTDGEHCNTPPPDIICTDGKHCNTPPPGTVCTDGEHCNTPPPDKDINEDDAANFNLNQKPVKFDFDLVKSGDTVDNNRCEDGVNCNTPPPEDDYEQNGVNGNVDGMGMASGYDDVSFVASGDSQLPESQQGMESDVNFNPTSPALAKIDISGVHGRESPDRLVSGEITPADMVEYGMDEESDGLSSGLGTVGNTPDQPEPPSAPAQEDFAAADVRPSGSESPEIQSEQPSSGVEMEDASPSDHPHPWEPTIELSTDIVVESSPAPDVLVGSPEIQVTEPAEMISEAIDSEDNVGQQGALDASCELDESSEEISQASEIEVKPNLPEDDVEGIEVADSQQNLMQYGGEVEEGEKTNTESALPEAEEGTYQADMEPNPAETDDPYLLNNAPESEQVGDVVEETTDSNVPAAEPEADQQVFAEESYAVESQFAAPPQFAAPAKFGAPPDFGDETQGIDIDTQEIPKETDLDEAIKERDFDEEAGEAEGQEVVQETNLDEVESPAQEDTIVHETDLDEFAIGVQQQTEAEFSHKQESAEEFGVDVTSAVEVEEVKQIPDQDNDVAAEVYGQSEEPEVDDALIQESAQETYHDEFAIGVQQQTEAEFSHKQESAEEFGVDVTSAVEVEEVKQIPDQGNDVAAEVYEQSEEPEVDDALIQESAQETYHDEFAIGVQQQTEAEFSHKQEPAEEFGVDVTSAVEVEEVKQIPDQDNDVAAEVYGQSEEPEVDDALIQESAQETYLDEFAIGVQQQTEAEFSHKQEPAEEFGVDVTSAVEVEEVKQIPDQDNDVAAEVYEQSEEPEVDDALIQESAQETDLDEFAIGVQQQTEAEFSHKQGSAEEFGVDVTSAVEVEEVKQIPDQDNDVAAEVYEQSEEPEVDDALIQESAQETDVDEFAIGVQQQTDAEFSHKQEPAEEFGVDVTSAVEVEEVKQIPDQDNDIAAEVYEQSEEPEVGDALIQESAQEIVQEAVGAAVGVVERDQMLYSDDIMQDDVVHQDTVPDAPEDFGTDVDAGREDIPAVEEPYLLEEGEVREEAVSVTEPTISDSLEQNATDSLEDLQNEAASDVDIPPVIEEEVSAQVEEQQESVPEGDLMQEATPAPIVEVGGDNLLVDMGEDNVIVPEVDHEVRPEPAVEPAISDEQVLLDHSSPPEVATLPLPLEEPTQEESKEIETVLKEPEIMQESLAKVLESSTVQPEQQTQSTAVVVEGSSVAVTKSAKSSSRSTGKRSPSPTKSASKSLKDKDKAKKPTDKAKAADSRTKTGIKSPLKTTEKKTAAKTPVTSTTKKTVLERKTSSETKSTARKSLVEKKPLEKKLSDKKTPAEKKQPSKTRLPPSSTRGTEKKSSSLESRSSQQASSSSTDSPPKKLNGAPSHTLTKKKTSTLASTPTSRPGAKQPDSQRPSTAGRPASGVRKAGDSKKANDRPTRSAPSSRGDAKSNGSKKAGSATAKSATPAKAASIPASGPAVHLDLAYIPNHASADSINSEFFRRVRAKNYVMSANDKARNQPAVAVLDALLEGKMKWEDAEAEVTVIPTYDYLALRDWELNKHPELSKAKIEISQPACRSIVQMKDENFFMYKVEL